jgi:hypothetical protein
MGGQELGVILRHLIPLAESLGILDGGRIREIVNQTVDQMGPGDLAEMARVADEVARRLRREALAPVPTGPPAVTGP